ncbi:hypothetical protein ABS71_02815 [bacterium SCN 62-11]|nr:ImmA/IrrE family metallo-endopeptidase [Candidatus Eremiobacteraeota bacterium]ODT77049.1 MAG: hypothetical protein ABS71_02815 [bacterium SCN 62-11]
MTELEKRCVADCRQLLARVRRKHPRPYGVPAEVIKEAIALAGYTISFEEMEDESDLAHCDAEERRVVVAKDFGLKLDCPWVAHQVLNFTLAHELGHARLHAPLLRSGEWHPHWEEEATFYARVFLIPHYILYNRPELDRLLDTRREQQPDRWGNVLELAETFHVSGKFMAHTLDAYGILHLDTDTRTITFPGEA